MDGSTILIGIERLHLEQDENQCTTSIRIRALLTLIGLVLVLDGNRAQI